MKIVDTNVLLYAVDEHADRHAVARAWLVEALEGSETIGFTWSAVLGFLRLATHPAVASRPLTVEEATGVIEGWIARPSAAIIEPGAGHVDMLRRLLAPIGTAGNLVNDAHLAAIAIEYAAEVVSFDTDFGRFPGVRWHRPGQ